MPRLRRHAVLPPLLAALGVWLSSGVARAAPSTESLSGRVALGLGFDRDRLAGRAIGEGEWWLPSLVGFGLHLSAGRTLPDHLPPRAVAEIVPQLWYAPLVGDWRALFAVGAGWASITSSPYTCSDPLCGGLPAEKSGSGLVVAAQAGALLYANVRAGVGSLGLRGEWRSAGGWAVLVVFGSGVGGPSVPPDPP